MELMKRYPDNHFELAVIDPPYGINITSSGSHFKEKYDIKNWDTKTPSKEFFDELFRVSQNQIIWGGNYFLEHIGNCKCFIIWDKKIAEDMSFAMCEMAWTSFISGAKIYKTTANQLSRIHPTQKPVELYKWILRKYGKPGDKILDTHMGSGSIAIACHDLKFNLTACEMDEDYYKKAIDRIQTHVNSDIFYKLEKKIEVKKDKKLF